MADFAHGADMTMGGEPWLAAPGVQGPPQADGGLRAARRMLPHAWIWRRVGIAILTIAILSVIVFGATQVLPGNAAHQLLGRNATPANIDQAERQLGLDRPITAQYLGWAGGAITGDLGTSLANHVPVTTVIGPPLRNSGVLLLLAALISVPLAILLGVLAAARRGSLVDHAFGLFSFAFTAVPEFVVALTLVILLATTVASVLPAISIIPPGESPLAHLDAFVLPVTTLVLAIVPYLGRLVRASMIDVLQSDYVQTARFKGVGRRRILLRHALPNAIVPAIQGVAVAIGYLAGGIVVVEFVFGFPGIGTTFLQAISGRDVPVIQAAGLLLASVYVVVNLIADVLVVLLTPRLRTAAR